MPISRRTLLKSAAALAAPRSAVQLAYVGTYSSPQGPEGARGRGQGIYLFEMDRATGALKQRELYKNPANPAWLAFNPSRTHLYSANEIYAGAPGSVGAYAADRSTGRLTLLNEVSSQAPGPCHLSVHPTGKYVFVANYHGGAVAVIQVRPNGELGDATDVKHDEGKPGPEHAASAPPGSFAISGHERTHAHMIESDPSGRFVLWTDLGLDRIYVWRFDVNTGKLSDPQSVSLPPGDGPRHFAFHPNGRWLYSLQEEASTLVLFDWSAGKLAARQTVSTLPKGFAGTNFTSEVMISADAKFLYCANRLHDSIAWFRIAAGGALTWAGEAWTRGDYPRFFNIDPSGNFLYSCNQRADAITSYRVNKQTGDLAFTGQYTPVGTPAAIIFLT